MASPPDLIGVLAGVIIVSSAAHYVGFVILRRTSAHPGQAFRRSVVDNIKAPTRLLVPLIGLDIAIGAMSVPPAAENVLSHLAGAALVFTTAWLVVRTTFVLDDLILARYQLDATDNLHARSIHTQIQVLRRVTVVAVAVVAVAVVLLSFSSVRAAGAGLLASAGVLGIVAAIAAKPTATNVMAGLQIALSQPFRIDDVVVVEGHWGRVEQIALTYVIVRVWDLRRLVLPISYFVDHPFENWTRSSADILGWVHLEVDYSAPVDAVRKKFHEVLTASPDWDGHVWVLQVTRLGTETMQLRALMSSPDSSRSWNLQCEVREQLVRFLRDEHPTALPRLRVAGAEGPRPAEPPGEESARRPSGAALVAEGDGTPSWLGYDR